MLSGAADLFNRPKLGEPALLLWWDAVKTFTVDDVVEWLGMWVRTESKMPLPRDFIDSRQKDWI
jgi:hypothetical protein